MKNFDTAARRGASAVDNAVEVAFQIDGEELIAYPPTSGQMVLLLTAVDGGIGSIQAMFDFLGAVLDDDGVELIKDKLQEGMDLAIVTEIVQYLIEEWSGRPTESSSDSPASRKSTGQRSTAKPRKKAATTRSR